MEVAQTGGDWAESQRVFGSGAGCGPKISKWAGSRREAGTFSEHCKVPNFKTADQLKY